MKIIINAVQAFFNSIKVDMEINKLAKELDRKGFYIIDPSRIRVTDGNDDVEGYTITKGAVTRDIAVGYDQRVVPAHQHRPYIKNILTRHGYKIEKIYIIPVEPVVGKSIKAYTVAHRTMGE